MTKAEKNIILADIAVMSDKTLVDNTVELIYKSLGSQVNEMYERGYDLKDIIERQKYEKYISEKTALFQRCCTIRGIDLEKYL